MIIGFNVPPNITSFISCLSCYIKAKVQPWYALRRGVAEIVNAKTLLLSKIQSVFIRFANSKKIVNVLIMVV